MLDVVQPWKIDLLSFIVFRISELDRHMSDSACRCYHRRVAQKMELIVQRKSLLERPRTEPSGRPTALAKNTEVPDSLTGEWFVD